jgi:membrane fusion protein, multidrug efflux system
VVDAQNTVRIKKIDMGRDFGKTVEILTGIDPTDKVVVNPPDSIDEGMHVRIAPPPPSNPANQTGGKAPP